MHLRGVVNGTKEEIDKWRGDLEAQFLNYQCRDDKNDLFNKDKPFVNYKRRISIRYTLPVDITFPKDELQQVLNLTKPILKEYKLLNWARRIMGLKKVQEWERIPCLFDNAHAVQFHAIGIKEDKELNGVEQL